MNFKHVPTTVEPSTTAGFPFQTLATPEQISKYLQVTPQTVNSWCRSGIIPSRVNEGRIVRFHLAEVIDALSRRIAKPLWGGCSASSQSGGLKWVTQKSSEAFQVAPPTRLCWQIRDASSPSACVFAPAARLHTVSQVADVIQTTRQTVNLWVSQDIIPVRISLRNVIRCDLEEVLEILAKRAVANRATTQG